MRLTLAIIFVLSGVSALARGTCAFVCSVGEFGIDSNVFATNYKAPTKYDHIGVALVHVDDHNPHENSQANAKKDSTVAAAINAVERGLGLAAQPKESLTSSEVRPMALKACACAHRCYARRFSFVRARRSGCRVCGTVLQQRWFFCNTCPFLAGDVRVVAGEVRSSGPIAGDPAGPAHSA